MDSNELREIKEKLDIGLSDEYKTTNLEQKIPICHDCGVKEGELHEFGCDMERCPFCGHQLISCNCCYKHLDLFDYTNCNISTSYLSREIYENGLNIEQIEKWHKILTDKGRIPYLVFPPICSKCGKLWPEFFHVSDEEWKRNIPIKHRENIICIDCYNYIKSIIKKNTGENND